MKTFLLLLLTVTSVAADFISPRETADLLAQGRAILIDVREASEIAEGGMAQPARWMPMSAVDAQTASYHEFIAKLPKDEVIVVYCRSGRRSGIFIDRHAHLGLAFENMGAFAGWKNAGLPVKLSP